MNVTSLMRPWFSRRVKVAQGWEHNIEKVQRNELQRIVSQGKKTQWGHINGLGDVDSYEDYIHTVGHPAGYDEFRPWVMRMIDGERDVLWPGVTRNYAQSSGTSDGKSKYIPITHESFSRMHYRGGSDVVANYLHLYPDSRIFDGKAFILGGSFANELSLPHNSNVKVGDLSANLIANINPLAEVVRVPHRDIALMEQWEEKLPALVKASIKEKNITNISGVPSWFLTVLKEVLKMTGAATIHDVWPRLEVFFHGGISFRPYREQYRCITDVSKMRYLETYNASEGFFAVQNAIDDPSMLLLLDAGVFYEFIPIDEAESPEPSGIVPAWKVEKGKIYALVITACNGLWRYKIGDTVRIESVDPLKITIAGRTRHFINAFGEELMVDNADRAIATICNRLDCEISNYTAAPVYAGDRNRGRHQWLVEFNVPPRDINEFAMMLDKELQSLNSDYQAKRQGGIFLDQLSVTVAPAGLFDCWLASTGKLGGQRKVPRLCNDRRFIDPMLAMMK